MLKVWGRKNSANVQKVMWAIGELKLPHERIDIAGAFGKNREATYLALNPNGLVPTLEDGDLVLWESNTIVRYLAREHGKGSLEPADPKARARAGQWMDWQLSVLGPAIHATFWGLVRLDAQLARTAYVAGDEFSMGDIPVGIFGYRFHALVKERPPLPHFERWFAAISARTAFRDHILSMPLD